MGAVLIVIVIGAAASLGVTASVVRNLRRARASACEYHSLCWREARGLRQLRKGTRTLRWAILFALAANGLVEVYLVMSGALMFAALLGLWMIAMAGLWTQLGWPPELERRLMRSEREAQQPWDVII